MNNQEIIKNAFENGLPGGEGIEGLKKNIMCRKAFIDHIENGGALEDLPDAFRDRGIIIEQTREERLIAEQQLLIQDLELLVNWNEQ